MTTALLVRLRPTTPWRLGPSNGVRERVECVLHSDTLYSALCHAFAQLGGLEEWLDATAGAASVPAVRLSSGFPMQRGTLFAPPPSGLWPPSAESGTRTRWHGARFVPFFALNRVLRGEGLRDDDYELDGHSGCLLPSAAHQPTGPFRFVRRTFAAVDRASGASAGAESFTCLQFAPGSGLWCVAAFANPIAYAVWSPRLQAAFRLLADSGIGGLRSHGFGRCRQPEFQPGLLPELLFNSVQPLPVTGDHHAWWMLSLFAPGPSDQIQWAGGDYSLTTRAGRVESLASSGAAKLQMRMIQEGSVIISKTEPCGCAVDVAPEEVPHPVWRWGYALALPIPFPAEARSAG